MQFDIERLSGQNFWNPLTITYNRFKKVFNQIVRKNEKEKNFAKIPQVEQRETSLLFVEACVIL